MSAAHAPGPGFCGHSGPQERSTWWRRQTATKAKLTPAQGLVTGCVRAAGAAWQGLPAQGQAWTDCLVRGAVRTAWSRLGSTPGQHGALTRGRGQGGAWARRGLGS